MLCEVIPGQTNALVIDLIGHKPGSVQFPGNCRCQVWRGLLETWIWNHSPGNTWLSLSLQGPQGQVSLW